MDHSAERRSVVTAVFAATGKKVDEDDPIIVAALFHAYTMREASREAAGRIADVGHTVQQAVDEARKAALEARAIVRQVAAEEKKRAGALDARVTKALREAGRVHSSEDGPPTGWRGVMAGMAMGLLLFGGLLSVVCGFSFSWISDSRIGAEFRRAVPTMDPSLRDKLIADMEKRTP
jgi:hypothetical protein